MYSNQCQVSNIDCFEKVVDGFELRTIFAKRSSERFGRALNTALLQILNQSGEETNAIGGTIKLTERQKYQAF